MTDCCSDKETIIYTCSGASDVGEIADRVARKLRSDGYGKMSCLAAIGSNQFAYVESAKIAENITIDGCPIACAKKTLENIEIIPRSYVLTEMGLTKGKTPITPEIVDKIANEITKSISLKSPSEQNNPWCTC